MAMARQPSRTGSRDWSFILLVTAAFRPPGGYAGHAVVPDRAESQSGEARQNPWQAVPQQFSRDAQIDGRSGGASYVEGEQAGQQAASSQARIAISEEIVEQEIGCHG